AGRQREQGTPLGGGHLEQLLEPRAGVRDHVVPKEPEPAGELVQRGIGHERRRLHCAPKIADGPRNQALTAFRPTTGQRVPGPAELVCNLRSTIQPLTRPCASPTFPRMGSPSGRPGRVPAEPEFATLQLDRRRFLVVLGGFAAVRAVAPGLAWARRAASPLPVLQPWTLPEALPVNPIEAARALVGAAVLAPSYFNAQPWRFEVDTTELRVLLDPARTLPLTDPDQRFAQMSLGAALENLLVAARAWGQQP